MNMSSTAVHGRQLENLAIYDKNCFVAHTHTHAHTKVLCLNYLYSISCFILRYTFLLQLHKSKSSLVSKQTY